VTVEDLPEGWRTVQLHEVADVALGKMLDRGKRTQGIALPYLRNASVRWDGFDLSDLLTMPYEDHELERYSVRPGDVFVCEGGEPGRAAIWAGGETSIKYQKALLRVRPGPLLHPRWLIHSLYHDAMSGRLEQYFTGSTIKHFPREAALRYEFPLPSLAEQRGIIEKVDSLLAQVNAARARLRRLREILKRFRQSILAAAVSGRITDDWRAAAGNPGTPALEILQQLRTIHKQSGISHRGNAAKPSEEAHDLDPSGLPATWVIAELMWLCDPKRPITYGILKPGPHHADGVPYVRVADFPNDELRLGEIRRTTRTIADAYRRSALRTGDVLLSIRGSYGRLCRVPAELNGANITQDTARLALHELVNAEYVVMALRSPTTQDRMRRAARGVAVRGLNIGDVRALQLALPPRKEADEIVRRVKALLALADRSELHNVAAVSRSEKISQSVRLRALRGELAPTPARVEC